MYHCASPATLRELPSGKHRFELLVPRGWRAPKVELVVDQRGNAPWFRMRPRKGRRMDRYVAEVELPRDCLITYRFRIQGERGRRYLDAGGVTPYRPGAATAYRVFPGDAPPAWPREQVFYQIFPDRFRRSARAPALDDLGHRGHGAGGVARPWGARPKKSQGWREFYGGDLDGIVEGLDYLQDLGVTALYLNPIFEASSVHRYDTKDYRRVDPLLGGQEAYERMTAELRERNMRFVLDGVFNHTGDECSWFDPQLRGPTGAWYTPGPQGGYMAWWDVHTLPKLDFSNPAVASEVYAGAGSVTRAWLRGPHGADGWRLDVPACLGEGGYEAGNLRHLRGILDAAREENPEAYVFGEHFEPAGAWLDARVHDATMNYAGFTFPTAEWLAGRDYEGFETPVDAGQLARAWQAHRAGRCVDQRLVAFNLLSSHDVPRLLTRLGDDRALHRLAHVLLLTFPGVPCVYYGDEVGVAGGPDPDCRRTFPWDEGAWDGPTHELVRTLARLRRTHPALIHGDLRADAAHPDVLRMLRVAGEDVAVVLVNRGEGRRRVELDLAGYGFQGEELVDVLDGRPVVLDEGRARVGVGPRKARVLVEPATLS